MSYSDLLNATFKTEDAELFDVVLTHIKQGTDVNAASKFGETPLRQVVRRGRMDVAQLLLDHGAELGQLNWGPLHCAVAFGDAQAVSDALAQDDADARDAYTYTPYLRAVQMGAIDKAEKLRPVTSVDARYLLARRDARRLSSALTVAAGADQAGMAQWLLDKGEDVNEAAEFGRTALIEAAAMNNPDVVAVLLKAGADLTAAHNVSASLQSANPNYKSYSGKPTLQTAMSEAQSPEVVKMLIGAGAALSDFREEVIAQLVGADRIAPQTITPAQFADQMRPRFGTTNPQKVDQPLWVEAIRTRKSGYGLRKSFGDGNSDPGPVWSHQRYGMSTTGLPDGRWVQIAGEHEDFYDPDFCIYSDVFLFDGAGGVEIYIYPEDVFPPTDFHSATYVDDAIILIGSLSYVDRRQAGICQVLRLDLADFSVAPVETTGPSPGWISRHDARLENGAIRVSGGEVWTGETFEPNADRFELSLSGWTWRKL